MDEIILIKANNKDAELVSKLICELLKDFNERSGSDFIINQTEVEDTCKDLLQRENFGAFIALKNKTQEPIGLITITQATAIYNGGDFGVITELYVDKNQRSRGVGKLLIQKAIEFARIKNWKKIEVGAPNKQQWPRTIEFYKKNGFEEKGPKLRISI